MMREWLRLRPGILREVRDQAGTLRRQRADDGNRSVLFDQEPGFVRRVRRVRSPWTHRGADTLTTEPICGDAFPGGRTHDGK